MHKTVTISELRTSKRNQVRQGVLRGDTYTVLYYGREIAVVESYPATDSSIGDAVTISLLETAQEGGFISDTLLSGKTIVVTNRQRPAFIMRPL